MAGKLAIVAFSRYIFSFIVYNQQKIQNFEYLMRDYTASYDYQHSGEPGIDCCESPERSHAISRRAELFKKIAYGIGTVILIAGALAMIGCDDQYEDMKIFIKKGREEVRRTNAELYQLNKRLETLNAHLEIIAGNNS